MNREEFAKLSMPEMLIQIWSALQERGSVPISGAPTGGPQGKGDGRAPKYDWSIHRKGGMVQYASETDLDGLIFWRNKSAEPPSDPKYAESNEKAVTALDYFIAYRRANPSEQWRGERNRESVVAAAPSAKPATYPKGMPTSALGAPSTPTPTFSDDDPENEIPF